MDWHFGTRVLFASDADGTTWMWKIPSGDCKTFSNTGVAATCCQVLPGGSSLAVGYASGVIKIWDLASGSCKHTISGTLKNMLLTLVVISVHTDDFCFVIR